MVQLLRPDETVNPQNSRHSNHLTRTRNVGQPKASAVSSVLFHPDFNRRPRNYTGSADLPQFARIAGALAGFWLLANYRRWGVTPRPENVDLF
jgi:hypothetical protein